MSASCFLLLGSNKGDKLQNLTDARKLIDSSIAKIIGTSSIYESEPWGYEDNEPYYNQALRLESKLKPEQILYKCFLIEKQLGRTRTKSSYEARTIDIDIIFYGDVCINTEILNVPHPKLQDRRFALEALSEIGPDFIHPLLKKSVVQLLEECTDNCWIKKLP